MTFPGSLRSAVTIGVMIAVACLIFAVLTMCQQSQRTKAKLQTENATGRALDRVTTQTQAIEADKQEKQADVDKIPGSDQRLPDGYGSRLECVRRGSECKNP